jgi:ribosomal protein L31
MSIKNNKFKFSLQTTVLTDGSTVQMPVLGDCSNKFHFLEIDSVKHPVWHHLKDFRELKQTGRLTDFNKKFGDFI